MDVGLAVALGCACVVSFGLAAMVLFLRSLCLKLTQTCQKLAEDASCLQDAHMDNMKAVVGEAFTALSTMSREALFTLKADTVDQVVAANALKDQYALQTAGLEDTLEEWRKVREEGEKLPEVIRDISGREFPKNDLEFL